MGRKRKIKLLPHHQRHRKDYLKAMRAEFEGIFGPRYDLTRDEVGGYTNPITLSVFSALSTAHQIQQERVDYLIKEIASLTGSDEDVIRLI